MFGIRPESRSRARGEASIEAILVLALGVLALLAIVAVGIAIVEDYTVQYSSGDSMEPTLYSGSLVLVDEDADPEVGDLAVVDGDEGRVVHRAVERRESGYVIQGDAMDDPDLWRTESGLSPTVSSDRTSAVVAILYDGRPPIPIPSDESLSAIMWYVALGVLARGSYDVARDSGGPTS